MGRRKANQSPAVFVSPAAGENDDIIVCSKLVTGQMFRVGSNTVVIAGKRVSKIQGAYGDPILNEIGMTKVNKNAWDNIKKVYGNMTLFKDGFIFEANNFMDAESISEERSEIKTGFEQASQCQM